MFCFKQMTAYEMRISDWSSDVCSSDLVARLQADRSADAAGRLENLSELARAMEEFENLTSFLDHVALVMDNDADANASRSPSSPYMQPRGWSSTPCSSPGGWKAFRSEEHTSALQSLMRTS